MGGTASNLFSSLEDDITQADGDTPELDSQLLQTRQRFLAAIKYGSDCSQPLVDLLFLKCPVTMKYAVLNVKDLLQKNNQSVQNLKNIPVALNILEKYGRHLLKPKTVRNELWRYVKFSNPIFRDRVDPLNDGRELMKMMGYTQEIEDGLFFPEPHEPDLDKTANIVADIILAKKEMEMYLSGTHPQPHAIEKFLPQNTVSDVHMLRVGVPINELGQLSPTQTTPLSSQVSAVSVATAPKQIYPSGVPLTGQTVETENQGETLSQSVSEASLNKSQKLCDICGDQFATTLCVMCDYKQLCSHCDDMWHKHPRRQNHNRDPTSPSQPKVNPVQTNTIQGPYGIQARPVSAIVRDGGHSKTPSQQSSTPKPAVATATPPKPAVATATPPKPPVVMETPPKPTVVTAPTVVMATPSNQEELPVSLTPSPSEPLKNVPNLDSLAPTPSSSVELPVESQSNSAAQSSQQRVPPTIPDRRLKPLSLSDPHKNRLSLNLTSAQQTLSQQPSNFEPADMEPVPVYLPPNNISQPVKIPSMPVQSSVSARRSSDVQRSDSMAAMSKLLNKIKEEPNLEKRVSKCDINILTLGEEMEEIEEKLNTLIETKENFYEDEEFMTLNRKKGLLKREKIMLEKYKKELDESSLGATEHFPQSPPMSQVFYPPASVDFNLNNPNLSPMSPPYHVQGYPDQPPGAPYNTEITNAGRGFPVRPVLYSTPVRTMVQAPTGLTQPVYQGQNVPRMAKPGSDDESMYYSAVGQPRISQPGYQNFQSNIGVCGAPPHLAHLNQYGRAPVPTQSSDPQNLKQNISQEAVTQPKVSLNHGQTMTQSETPSAVAIAAEEKGPNKTNDVAMGHTGQASLISSPTEEIKPIAGVSAKPSTSSSSKNQSGYNRRWQCEHCTMFNDSGTRICSMCDRTSDSPSFFEGTAPTSSSEPTESEETAVVAAAPLTVGMKILQEQDQVYFEKQEAHRKYQETLRREKERKTKSSSPSSSEHAEAASSDKMEPSLSLTKTAQSDKKPHVQNVPVPNIQNVSKHAQKSKEEQILQKPDDRRSSGYGSIVPEETGAAAAGGGSHVQGRQFTFQETMESINEQRHIKKTQLDGADLLQLFKTADQSGYDIPELEVALELCQQEGKSAIDWLKTRWDKLVDMVVAMGTTAAQESEQNDIGTLSTNEVKQSLQDNHGNAQAAARQCINARKTLYAEVNRDGSYAREDVLEAMHEHEGNKDKVQKHLDMMKLAPFKHRIWEGSDELPDFMHMALHPSCNSVSTSVISHQNFQEMVKNKAIELERRIRMVLVEARLQSWGRAETVIKILDDNLQQLESESEYEYTLEDVVEAVRNCQDRRSSIVYLQRECSICFSKYPMSKMMNLNICQCQMCRDCLKQNFEVSIKEKHVRNWVCPICSLPDFNDENVAADYLNLLQIMLNTFVEKEVLDLFETKVRDWYLQKDPNFRWCAHCGNGFLYQGWQNGAGHLSMTCQQCRKKTCFLCKKQWEQQHEGLTCEQFTQWKIDNDPQNQAVGLARVLDQSGIDCPSCKMRYSLAKGGCMHFKCPECAHEFCSGCSQPFYKQGACARFKTCATQGLHCHHPRDCFFYLRDNDIEELQSLLNIGKVHFNIERPVDQNQSTCPVMEQKDGEIGSRQDEACGKEVGEGNAGLCLMHYKEYLVGLINRSKLDPVNIMTHEQLKRLFGRMEVAEPKRRENETQNQYKKRLITFIKDKIPLHR